MRPLFRAFPKLAENIQHIEICDLPTPIERLQKLEESIGHSAIYVKRKD